MISDAFDRAVSAVLDEIEAVRIFCGYVECAEPDPDNNRPAAPAPVVSIDAGMAKVREALTRYRIQALATRIEQLGTPMIGARP